MDQATGVNGILQVFKGSLRKCMFHVASILAISFLSAPCSYAQQPYKPTWVLPHVWHTSPDAEKQQTYYYNYMWESFIALNWPSDLSYRGKPNADVSILDQTGKKSPLQYVSVWETYREPAFEVYLPSGNWGDYPKWNHRRQLPGNAGTGSARPLKDYNGFLEYAADLNQPDFFPYPTGPLVDQHGNYVRYEVAVNEAFFTYVKHFRYYDANAQIRSVQRYIHNPTDTNGFKRPPHGTTKEFDTGYLKNLPKFPYAQQGMIDVKAAWRVLDIEKGDKPERYLNRKIQFNEEESKLMGLVALHILRFTMLDDKPVQVAATFEQVDNVSGIKPSFNPGITPDTSAIQKDLGFEGAIPAMIPKHFPPVPPPIPDSMDIVDIYRVTPLLHDVKKANTKYQAMLKGSVFQYYQLIGTQNKHPGVPLKISFVDSLRYKNGHQGPLTGVYTNTNNLINTALESYTQKNHSCIQCHVRARPIGVPTQAREVDHFKTLTFLNQFAHFPTSLTNKKGVHLEQGEYIVNPNHHVPNEKPKYFAILQVDGNFCVSEGKGPEDRDRPKAHRCALEKGVKGGKFSARVKDDGRFCVYDRASGKEVQMWCSNNAGDPSGEYFAQVRDDGRFGVWSVVGQDTTNVWYLSDGIE